MIDVPDYLEPEHLVGLSEAEAEALLREGMKSKRWRLNNLYRITDKSGRVVRFRMNDAQERYFADRHTLNINLKARQLGFSTLIQLDMLDSALFRADFSGYVIAQGLDEATKIFKTKIRDVYDRLPAWFRAEVKATGSTTRGISFSNGSSIGVGVSARSGTVQHLHVSEFGKICSKYPEKAREIVTGALNAVDVGQRVDIESTAEGQYGYFYDMTMEALSMHRQGVELSDLDYRFHFFPWWGEAGYVLPYRGELLAASDEKYFNDLAHLHGIRLTNEQKLWYVKKKQTQQEDMKREYPSYPEEAFEQAIAGAIYGEQLARADSEGRITDVAYHTGLPVHTSWDLGHGDATVIWFFQVKAGGMIDYIDYYEANQADADHYARILKEKGYYYGNHYMPHDADSKHGMVGKSSKDMAQAANIRPIVVVPRTPSEMADIKYCRMQFSRCRFDRQRCVDGLKALRSFQCEWNDKYGRYNETPRKDWTNHAADGFRCGLMGMPLNVESMTDSIINRHAQRSVSMKRNMQPIRIRR